MAILCTGPSVAQLTFFPKEVGLEEQKWFNHASIGLSVGLDGIGFDVAAPMTHRFALRLGGTFMPKIKYSTTVGLGNLNDPAFLPGKSEVGIEGKLNMNNFHFLVDYHPFKRSSFRLTAGAYIGPAALVRVYNTEAFLQEAYYGSAGLELGESSPIYNQYSVVSDQQGNIQLDLKTNVFKPYVGIGFGRAISKKRVNVLFDLGVQFWGKPGIASNVNYFDINKGEYVNSYEKIQRSRILNEGKSYQDIKDVIKIMEKVRVYPVLKLTISGRIF